MTEPVLSARERAMVFHALSDETRLAILDHLRAGERCVCDLQADVDAAQSRLSFHLKVLREAGLVRDRKEGRWSYYTLVPERLAAAAAALVALTRPGTRRSDTRAVPTLHQLARRRAVAASSRSSLPAAPESSGDCCD